jgi:transcriptional regulator with XRE-family HTH domain
MSQRRYPPNRFLAWERLQRGWSYEEAADRIRAEMSRCGERDTGLTANTVRRWETGERWPEARYRKHLVTILGKPASDLGLLTPDELSARPRPVPADAVRGVLDTLLGSDDGVAGVDRASVLRGLLGVGALPFLAPLLSFDPTGADVASRPSDPETYATIARCHQRLYWTAPASLLYEAAYAHTHLGVGVLRGATGRQRAELAVAVAESALLTARLAFFDLGYNAVADRCLDVALAATREAGDHALAATVLGHMAFGPAFAHQPEKARSLLAAAFQHTWHGVHPMARSWLHCVASEVEGRAGAGSASRHQVDLAAGVAHSDVSPPSWLDFYDTGRLQAFSGYAALVSGDHAAAVEHLNQALHGLAASGDKQRVVVLADLAAAHRDDGDHAADYLNQAVALLRTQWYGTGLDRVRAVRPVLGDGRHGREIDEQVLALTATASAITPR